MKHSRRNFLMATTAAAAFARLTPFAYSQTHGDSRFHPLENYATVPDEDWQMWADTEAAWKDDEIFLPGEFDLAKLPSNPPTGGWQVLRSAPAGTLTVPLPATIEQYLWGKFGLRSYTGGEYRYEDNEKNRTNGVSDTVPQNGAYRGVSWFWREIEIPESFNGRSIWLHLRGARQRAEVYLNQKLVGYTILEELPYECEITTAAKPGTKNQLAIRITNPGGRYDWVDGDSLTWGKVSFQKSHGFGGVDRGLSLTSHRGVRIVDAWVLNTAEPRKIKVFAEVSNLTHAELKTTINFILRSKAGQQLTAQSVELSIPANATQRAAGEIDCPQAALWTLEKPGLYDLEVAAGGDALNEQRFVRFGFRSFTIDGLGTNALFRLNGERTRMYSAISWGFWPLNGLFPTEEFAKKEVTAAQALGLNCLNFHRNPGKQDVLDHQDRMGLMRWMEPGGGAHAANKPKDAKTAFDQRYMQAKILHMIRTFRSHPSLMGWTLQNEGKTELTPELFAILGKMHEADPSRAVVANDGFTMRSHQAWYAPWDEKLRTSPMPGEPQPKDLARDSAGGWWNDHQAAGSDVWLDKHWKGPNDYQWRSEDKGEIVQWGEMEGSAMLDNHAGVLREIAAHGDRSYDKLDHEEIDEGYREFLRVWGFDTAYPTTEKLYLELGRRCYETFRQYMENARICDVDDYLSISGWESTAPENHSGIVDVFRDFKANPRLIAESLLPVRPVAKQRAMVYELGDKAIFDLYLLNDSNRPVTGMLIFDMIAPSGRKKRLGNWGIPAFERDVFSYPIAEALTTPALEEEGWYNFVLSIDSSVAGNPRGTNIPFARHIWVTSTERKSPKPLRVGLHGEAKELTAALTAIRGVTIEPYKAGERYDLLAFSRDPPSAGKSERMDNMGSYLKTDDAAALTLPAEMIAAIRSGTPAFGVATTTAAAISLGKQFGAEGAFRFDGMVGVSRAPWMGAWYFNREHALFRGMPQNCVLGTEYQVRGNGANGWLIANTNGSTAEIVTGYSRDHDRKVGAGTLTAKLGKGCIVLHRVPPMQSVMQRRFVLNVVEYLTNAG